MGILHDKLTEYSKSDYYPYHMPGHKRRPVGKLPGEWTAADITEIEGFDNLHQPEGILKTLQEKASSAYGAEESFYLVNGSTSGILSAISATVSFGGELLIVRNCHKSVYHGAYLRRLTLRYLYPEIVDGFDICEAITAEQVKEALVKYPAVEAVLVVSPTYEGRIADIEAIAEVVHAKGLPLIVDEAHGAHLGFAGGFAQNSNRLGADVVIHSLHKTLPSMTQTALLHCNGKLVDRDKIRRFLRIYQSSSPSYVLMAGMEEAVRMAVEEKEIFVGFKKNWNGLAERLSACQKIRILGKATQENDEECHKSTQDVGKLVLSVKETGLSGQQLYDILLNRYHLQMEMACESYVLAMFTVWDTEEGYERLAQAVLELDEELDTLPDEGFFTEQKKDDKVMKVPMPEEKLSLHEAWDEESEWVSLEAACGRIAGEFINLYPPGVPLVVPGEIVSPEAVQMLEEYLEAGLNVQGIDEKRRICVLR